MVFFTPIKSWKIKHSHALDINDVRCDAALDARPHAIAQEKTVCFGVYRSKDPRPSHGRRHGLRC